jgi:hypothetical protein
MFSSISEIRGFNYSGSWGTSGLDLWQHHDNGTMAVEIARGKKYFPGWNAARWWLSHEAFGRDQQRFLANFEAGLAIFARHDIQVMPVLFNRWRDPVCDFGGVSIDHFLREFGDEAVIDRRIKHEWSARKQFADYLENVVGGHSGDARIFAWDLCNEPLHSYYAVNPKSPISQAELAWLSWCRDTCKTAGSTQPLTIGCYDMATTELTEPLVDFISFHPYYIPTPALPDTPLSFLSSREGFERYLDDIAALAAQRGKDVLASETAWGDIDDAERVAIMRYTLGALVQRNFGFMAHALHHSLVADLHAAEYGPVGFPGRLEFINADGSLRAGHEMFNEFV